jgi:type I restriction enzyme S subunit
MTFPATWKSHKLGELAQYINGKAFKPEDWKTSGLPIIRIQNLTDSSKPFNYCDQPVEPRYHVNDGDLLISWSATLGSFIWDRGRPAVLNQHIFKAIPNTELVERDFLHFLMLETLEEMASHTHGIAMKHITKGKFEAIEVAIPPLPEQRRIVSRIKECMDRVEEIERLTSTVQQDSSYLPQAFRFDLWRECLDQYPMAELGTFVTSAKNGLYKPREHHGSGSILLRMFNINGAHFDTTRLERINVTEKEATDYSIGNGDIIVSRVNSRELVGKSTVVEGMDETAVFEAMLIRLRIDAATARQDVLAWLMNAPQFLHNLRMRAKHAIGQSSINQQDLLGSCLPLPPLDEQRQLSEKFADLGELAANLRYECSGRWQATSGLRESILRKAFDGEL